MAVVASFTHVQTGALTVAFTDTSTGSPNKWLWDFGDGFTSSDQNPTHVFYINGDYSVKLTAWLQTGSTTIGQTSVFGRSKSASGSTDIQAYNNWIAAPWIEHTPGIAEPQFRLVAKTVDGAEGSFSYDLRSLSGGIAELQVKLLALPDSAKSLVLAVNAGKLVDGTIHSIFTTIADVTSSIGQLHYETFRDGSSYSFNGLSWFMNISRVQHWTTSDTDSDTQTVSVRAFVADFIAVPSAPSSATPGPVFGVNPQSVDFTDQSDAGATAWSWRKRRAGTDDAFVEFSTDQHPTHIFDKDSP